MFSSLFSSFIFSLQPQSTHQIAFHHTQPHEYPSPLACCVLSLSMMTLVMEMIIYFVLIFESGSRKKTRWYLTHFLNSSRLLFFDKWYKSQLMGTRMGPTMAPRAHTCPPDPALPTLPTPPRPSLPTHLPLLLQGLPTSPNLVRSATPLDPSLTLSRRAEAKVLG